MATVDNSTTSPCTVLQELQARVETLYTDLQRQAQQQADEGEPLSAFGASCRAHGVDMALRHIDATIIKLQQEVRL